MNITKTRYGSVDKSILDALEVLNSKIVILDCGHKIRCYDLLFNEVETEKETEKETEIRITCPVCGE